jgi:hypothetical protein
MRYTRRYTRRAPDAAAVQRLGASLELRTAQCWNACRYEARFTEEPFDVNCDTPTFPGSSTPVRPAIRFGRCFHGGSSCIRSSLSWKLRSLLQLGF